MDEIILAIEQINKIYKEENNQNIICSFNINSKIYSMSIEDLYLLKEAFKYSEKYRILINFTETLSIEELLMETVTVSSKFQVVIPQSIREKLGVHPGQKVTIIPYESRIELVLFKPVQETRGFLKGIDTTVSREQDRL